MLPKLHRGSRKVIITVNTCREKKIPLGHEYYGGQVPIPGVLSMYSIGTRVSGGHFTIEELQAYMFDSCAMYQQCRHTVNFVVWRLAWSKTQNNIYLVVWQPEKNEYQTIKWQSVSTAGTQCLFLCHGKYLCANPCWSLPFAAGVCLSSLQCWSG